MPDQPSKKPSLNDLSDGALTEEEILLLFAELNTQTDRGAALIAGSFVEDVLGVALASRFIDVGRDKRAEWLEGDRAPVGTFSARIKIGRALGIYGPQTERQLNSIRKIRNVFAHTLKPVDFTHPAIIAECEPLVSGGLPPTKSDHVTARRHYIAMCLVLARRLYTNAEEQGGKAIEISLP